MWLQPSPSPSQRSLNLKTAVRYRQLLSAPSFFNSDVCVKRPARTAAAAAEARVLSKMSKRMREDAIPALDGGQLLRTCRQTTQKPAMRAKTSAAQCASAWV